MKKNRIVWDLFTSIAGIILFIFLMLICPRLALAQGSSLPAAVNKSLSMQDTIAAASYMDKGKSFANASKFDSSVYFYSNAFEIYNRLYRDGQNNVKVPLVRCMNNLSYVLQMQSRYSDAEILLDSALIIAVNTPTDSQGIAGVYNNMALLHEHKGNYDKALELYRKSLLIRLNLFGENSADAADTYNSLGIIYSYKSDPDKALENYQKSLAVKLKLFGEDHQQTAVAYNNLGIFYKDRGDYDKALEMHRKALSVRLKLLGENHAQVASSYSNTGLVYYNTGDLDKALEMHNNALKIRRQVFGEQHNHTAISYNNIGLVYWQKKNYPAALENFNKALEIRVKLFGEEHNDAAVNFMNIGLIYYEMGNDSAALGNYNKALGICLKLLGEKHYKVSQVYQNMSELYLRRKDYNTALVFCQKAILSLVKDFNDTSYLHNPPLSSIQPGGDILNSIKTKAKILAAKSGDLNDLTAALSVYEFADSLISKIRTSYRSDDSKLYLGEKAAAIYDEAIRASLNLYGLTHDELYKYKAFYFSEKSKAAVLQEKMAEANAKEYCKIPKELLNLEKQLRSELASYDTRLQNEYGSKTPDSSKIAGYENILFGLKNQYEELITELETECPEYYELKYQAKAAAVQDIQNIIPFNTSIVEYFTGDSLVNIFLIRKNYFDIISIKKPANFNELVRDFYTSIVKSENERYVSLSSELSSLIIRPVIEKINTDKLVIIPHGLLHKIPFEALFTKPVSLAGKKTDYRKMDYLVKKYDISYHYSASLYVNSFGRKKQYASGNNADINERSSRKKFLGFAPVFAKNNYDGYTLREDETNLLFSGSDETLRSLPGSKRAIPELKYSEWEVKSIINLFGGNSSTAYLYSDATEEAFKQNAGKYRILHLASHSFVNELKPQVSGIMFSEVMTDSVNTGNGILYAGEIYNLNLNADLVVLSSCESGLGKIMQGERGNTDSDKRLFVFRR
jgi:tetratricopeptide (TPR) repeat protein